MPQTRSTLEGRIEQDSMREILGFSGRQSLIEGISRRRSPVPTHPL